MIQSQLVICGVSLALHAEDETIVLIVSFQKRLSRLFRIAIAPEGNQPFVSYPKLSSG